MRLEQRELKLIRQGGPLLPQIEAALAAVDGRPLRWAVTAVLPGDGSELVLEAVFCLDDRP